MTIAPPAPTSSDARTTSLVLIRVLFDGLGRSARGIEQRTGITNAQLFLLQQLAETGGLSVGELADRARTKQSTVSIVVSRLVSAKLVRKIRSTTDGRRAVLTLTPAAKLLLRDAPAPPTAQLLRGLQRMRPDDVRALARGLGALVRTLELGGSEPDMLFEKR